jgi:hypothetical protein
MKKLKLILGTSVLAIAGLLTIAADHIDAPAVAGGTSDITDFYAFQGEDTNNVVFVANLQGLMSPSATAGAAFDENVMVEFNIDTTGDNVEDLVIQAIPKNGKMYVYGPYAPNHTGLSSIVDESAALTIVDVTPYTSASPITTTNTSTGLIAFAGPRDDPFFMDFSRYGEIIGGTATAFNNPGVDTFAGTNVMSVVIEVPKSLVGSTGTINTWVESKRKL